MTQLRLAKNPRGLKNAFKEAGIRTLGRSPMTTKQLVFPVRRPSANWSSPNQRAWPPRGCRRTLRPGLKPANRSIASIPAGDPRKQKLLECWRTMAREKISLPACRRRCPALQPAFRRNSDRIHFGNDSPPLGPVSQSIPKSMRPD